MHDKMSASTAIRWYALPEATSSDIEGKVGRKDPGQNTTSKDGSTPPQPVFVPTCTTSTPHTQMSVHNQSSQAADLTITSLLTISPPRHSPKTKVHPSTQNNSHQKSLTIPPLQQSSITQVNPYTRGKPTNSYGTHTVLSSPSNCTPGHPLSSQNSTSSLGSRPSSGHSQRDVTTHIHPLPGNVAVQSSSTCSTASVSYGGRPFPMDTALLTKQVSLLELDKLWQEFLTSSLLAKGKESAPAGPKQKHTCTCGASSTPAASDSTNMKRDAFSSNQFLTPDSSNSFECSGSSATLQLVDRSVQTSKKDLQPAPKAPATFTVPITTHSRKGKPLNSVEQPVSSSVTHTTHPPPTHSATSATQSVLSSSASPSLHEHPSTLSQFVGPLSLSEAFALRRPDFILRSQRRERRVREMGEMRVENASYSRAHVQHKLNQCYWKPAQPQTVCSQCKLKERSKSLHYVKVGQGMRPRMGHKKMYQATKKAWEKLPEVKKRAAEEKQRLEAETNRLRVKLYQKEVLARMRRGSRQK